jgi:hypothetical protein
MIPHLRPCAASGQAQQIAGFGQSPGLVPVAGLLQRISILTGLTWLTTLSARVLRD